MRYYNFALYASADQIKEKTQLTFENTLMRIRLLQ